MFSWIFWNTLVVLLVGPKPKILVSGVSTSPFLAADQNSLPDCQIYGRTYCLQIETYPTETIRYLLDNHLVDVSSIILSEGTPQMRNGKNQTHSLHVSEDGTLHSNFVQNRVPKKQVDSISIEVTHKIPISPKKIAIPNESDEIIRGQIAHLQPKKEHMNSVEISQPKDLSTSESMSAKPNKETLNFEHFPEKLISKSAPNTQNTKKLENLVKKELETPFIVHAEINKNNYVPSAEYEPPNPSQDFNFEQFEDVTTKTDRLLAASAKLLEKNSSNSKKFRQNEDENSNSNLEKPLPLTKPVTMKDPVYFNPSVQKKFENLQSVVPFEFEDDSPKKFSNPPSFSFKTIPTEPEVVTDLPKYTYSVKTSTSVNAFINFGENNNAAADQQEEEEINNITENLPKFTYKVIHGEPKKYNYNILDDQQLTTETPVPEENLSNNLESVRHYSFRFLDEEIPIENIQEPEQIAQHLGYNLLPNHDSTIVQEEPKKYGYNIIKENPENFEEIPIIHQENNIHLKSADPTKSYGYNIINENEENFEEISIHNENNIHLKNPDPTKSYGYNIINENQENLENIPISNSNQENIHLNSVDPTKSYGFQILENNNDSEEKISTKTTSDVPVKQFTYSLLENEASNNNVHPEVNLNELPLYVYEIEPPSVSHAIPTSLESIENLAQEIYDEHLAQISQENKQPSNGFKFVHSHTPKEELLSPHSGQPLKSYSYQYIDHSPATTVQPAYGLFQETKNDYVVHVNPNQKYEDSLNQATFYHSTTVSPPIQVFNENNQHYTYGSFQNDLTTPETPNEYNFGQDQNPYLSTTLPPKRYNYHTTTIEKDSTTTTVPPKEQIYESTVSPPPSSQKLPYFQTVSTTVKPKKKLSFSFATASYQPSTSTEKPFRFEESKSEKPFRFPGISTNAPRMPTTLGYFPKESKAPITPDLSNEERKKLGLVYYKPLSDELKALLEVKPNIEPRDVLPSTHNDPIQKLQKEISEELNELNVYAQDITSTYKNPSTTITKTSTSEYKAPTSGYETNNSGYKAPTSGSGHATSGYEINNSGYKAPTSGYEIITSDSGDPTPATKVVGVGSFSSYESPPALPTYKKPVYTKISQPKILIDNPSPPLKDYYDEFEFKPIINPPAEFYEFKPVQINPFHNDDIVLTAPGYKQDFPSQNVYNDPEILDEDIDVISAPDLSSAYIQSDTPPPIPDYNASPVEYEADSYGIPQYQPLKQEYQETAPYQDEASQDDTYQEYREYIQDSHHKYQKYVEEPPPVEDTEVPPRVDSDFLLKKAFRKVTDLFDDLFYRGFGLARSKRDLTEKPEGICPTRTHFIHPRVAFSVKGQWLFIVNLPGRSDQQQGIVTEECTTTECQGVCSSEQSAKKCEPQFVQKRLVALHPSGHKLISELFWFPATCRCVVK